MKVKRRNRRPPREIAQPVSRRPLTMPVAVAVIVLLGAFSYSNSLSVPFVLDDLPNILENPSIRNLGDMKSVLLPPTWSGVWDRPVVNLTLALNYAVSGERVWSYHALNLLIHILAGMALFGVVRRTFDSVRMKERYGRFSAQLALGVSLVWLLHPLQTQAVTYVIQRCESLMGLFFLLTLYCAIRGWQSPYATAWHALSGLSFLLGAGSKEVIVTAPLVVACYERIFVRDSFGEMLRRSWPLYAGYCVGFAVLGAFFVSGGRVTSAVTPWQYWQMQPAIILHYVRLAFWPAGLTFDYGWPVPFFHASLPAAVILACFIACAAWLLIRRSPTGFFACWFFAALATTSLVPLPDPAWEFRMYLPLAPLLIIALFALERAAALAGRRFPRPGGGNRLAVLLLPAAIVIVLALSFATYQRNKTYSSALTLWEDTVRKSPANSRARLNYGVELDRAGSLQEAVRQFREAIRLKPDYAEAYSNLGNALAKTGNQQAAFDSFAEAIRLNPEYANAYSNMGAWLIRAGKAKEAVAPLEQAVRLKPGDHETRSNLGAALGQAGRMEEAAAQFEKALRLRPSSAELHSNLGLVLAWMGRREEARSHLQEALRLRPDYREARANLEMLERGAGLAGMQGKK